ncbi:MAG: hypothetical protein HKN76_22635 [Saprospiraceae bacterium]|nr:hypothetical protein [Saprospiraceae bacterium]
MKPEIIKDDKTAVVVGCEGFVGEHLLALLNQHHSYINVKAISQKKIKMGLSKVDYYVASIPSIEFKQWKANDLFICYDASFFNSGGKYKIAESEYKYIPKMILKAFRSGMGQVILLSSKGTSSDALFHISRARGLIEEVVINMGFWSTHVFKPSILLGESINQKWGQGIADRIGGKIDQYTGGWLKKNKPIEAEVVAKAMLHVAQRLVAGNHTYSSEWLQDFAVSPEINSVSKTKK